MDLVMKRDDMVTPICLVVRAGPCDKESASSQEDLHAALCCQALHATATGYANSSTSATGRRGFCGQFPGRSGPTDNSITGTSSSDSPNSRCSASASKPIIGDEPR